MAGDSAATASEEDPSPFNLPAQMKSAETAAQDALKKAVQSIKALRSLSTINLSDEFSQLSQLMDELSTGEKPLLQGTSSEHFEGQESAAQQAASGSADSKSSFLEHLLDTLRPEDGKKAKGKHFSADRESDRGAPSIQAFYRNIPSSLRRADGGYSEEDFKIAHANAQNVEKPLRVLINSPYLLQDLEQITGFALPISAFEIIPPFKLLIHHWKDIISTLEKLTHKYDELCQRLNTCVPSATEMPCSDSSTEQAAGLTLQSPSAMSISVEVREVSPTENDKQSSSNEEHTVRKTLPEMTNEKTILEIRISNLRCLCDFIQADLGHLVGLKIKIQEGSVEKVLFEEVYHLYNPGDLIVGREEDVDLLYQVYAVTGGRRRLYKAALSTAYKPPGEELEADDSPRAGVGTYTDVVIDCLLLHWDGVRIGPQRITYRIPHFTGEKNIVDLDYFPAHFCKDSQELCERLLVRGKKVTKCYGHQKYDAQTATARLQQTVLSNYAHQRGAPLSQVRYDIPDYDDKVGAPGRDLDSDVYVDSKTFCQSFSPFRNESFRLGRTRPSTREVTEGYEFASDSDINVVADHDVDVARSENFLSRNFHLTHPQRLEDLEGKEECLMLLSECVPAFDFRQRKWDWVSVDKLEKIDKTQDARRRAWQDLVIEEGYSQLLLSLVDNHTSAYDHKKKKNASGYSVPTSQVDLIKGKGRGLILLLHGPPGTGKTSTAEAIAAYTGKPLYAITCGDIGVHVGEVEKNLREHTEQATKWDCVLLLDEADVFLARRTWSDMDRNAVISVFLRHLEYYSGILFLTTNIVGIIDEAFKSRIHVALRYDAIDAVSTKRIWNNLLDRIAMDNETSDVKIDFKKDKLLKFAVSHYKKYSSDGTTWNARQIRNAFSTAIAMGQYDRMERIRRAGLTPEQVVASGNQGLMTIKLSKGNFEKVADTATEFEEYINAVRGDDVKNALENQQRDDYFTQQLAPQPRKTRGAPVAYFDPDFKSSRSKRPPTKPLDSDEESDIRKASSHQGKSRQRRERDSDDEDGSDSSEGLSD
ncbi:hypothetical protein PFICI_10348 [Pestalotiopsis fici W106-1]|uniref:AAA+ ATPase domain-containing protein n=1 Tax=Pestalotiopsis fici (strain W106-1 / CGMCC3.15140) TaxID=1229662 RepID=W3WZH9_PESFW|nr:uncharacterized protein PFICI_10348 [Pestalotiopsis fici W106-1]ETS78286.1 hypothetical protein PFICI_10348 [Pestalotiopsis fici W106-1]